MEYPETTRSLRCVYKPLSTLDTKKKNQDFVRWSLWRLEKIAGPAISGVQTCVTKNPREVYVHD